MLRNPALLSWHLPVLVLLQLDLLYPSLHLLLHLDLVLLFHLCRGVHLYWFSLKCVMHMITSVFSDSFLQLINTCYQHLLLSYQYKDSSIAIGSSALPSQASLILVAPLTLCSHCITNICTYIHRYIYSIVFDVLYESLYYSLSLAWELKSPGGPIKKVPHTVFYKSHQFSWLILGKGCLGTSVVGGENPLWLKYICLDRPISKNLKKTNSFLNETKEELSSHNQPSRVSLHWTPVN